MALLAGVNYDPAVAVSVTNSGVLSAMTAFDTTNLRLTFTVPSNGIVQVRINCCQVGATTYSQILLGVLQGSTVMGRIAPVGALRGTAAATAVCMQEACFLVTGLTPGASLTWDAAYGVEVAVAASQIKYGGPNDTTATNAYGAFQFSIWSVA